MRAGILGTSGNIDSDAIGVATALEALGMNLGNCIYQHAVWTHIASPKVAVKLGASIDHLKSAVDVLVIPAANQINPEWDLSDWADLVEGLGKPVVIVGLGAQSRARSDEIVPLKSGTLRFLFAAAERAATVGVRGCYSAEVLNKIGIKNVEISGCPSNFISSAKNLGRRIQDGILQAASGLAVKQIFNVGTLEEHTRRVEANLTAIALKSDAKFVHQTNLEKVQAAFNREFRVTPYLSWERGIVAPEFSAHEYATVLTERSLAFTSARKWIEALSSFDLAYGQRIHGAIAAVQAGRPGICVTFDARTSELAEEMEYPRIEMDEALKCRSPEELARRTRFDADAFERRRRALLGSYASILAQSGLDTALTMNLEVCR